MKIIDFFKQHHFKLKNKTVIVAASGGPDSMALVNMLNELQKKEKFTLILAHLDHQLREDSEQETTLLSQYCHEHRLRLVNAKWPKDLQPQTGIEAAARAYRYSFLQTVMQKYHGDYLLTAHHGDDLLENILLKLIRSGYPEEMNSLQAVSKRQGMLLLRPLLSFSKKELLAYDRKHQLKFIEDQTNFEDNTMRNRLRHYVVPLLKKENPQLLKNALRFSNEENLLTNLANKNVRKIRQPEEFLRCSFRIKTDELKSLPLEEQNYYWRNFIWQKWHRRVSDYFPGYHLIEYQGFIYLWPSKLRINNEKSEIEVNKTFTFMDQLFLLTQVRRKDELIGDFWSADKSFQAGSLPVGAKLCLQNGHHAKAKKMFAQAAIPAKLRPFCLTIFNASNEPIFIENTYRDQRWYHHADHFYLYHLRKR